MENLQISREFKVFLLCTIARIYSVLTCASMYTNAHTLSEGRNGQKCMFIV